LIDQKKVNVKKSVHSDEYKEVSKQIKHAVKSDKEAFMAQHCEQLEANAKKNRVCFRQ